MYERAIILLLILLVGCQTDVKQSDFYETTSKRWMAATRVLWLSEHYKSDMKILKPAGTWQAILEVGFIDQNFKEVSDCVFYYVPKRGDDGILKIIPNKSGAPCSNLMAEQEYASISSIINFGYDLNENVESDQNLILKVDTKRFSYNFLNMTNNEFGNKKLSSSIKISKYQSSLVTSTISYQSEPSVLEEEAICFDVNDECEQTMPNRCSSCEYGYFSVVASKCKNKFRKICGKDECGLAGKPACLRGYIAAEILPENYCINGSPLGICQEGLSVICVNKVLMCE